MSFSVDLIEIGKRVESLRGTMSQAEFADRVGVDRKTVGTWERGERLPDTKALLALMEKFGADPAWVLTGTGATPVLAPDEAVLLDNYRHCPEEARAAIKATSDLLAQPKGMKKRGAA